MNPRVRELISLKQKYYERQESQIPTYLYQRKPASVEVQVWRRALTGLALPRITPHTPPILSTSLASASSLQWSTTSCLGWYWMTWWCVFNEGEASFYSPRSSHQGSTYGRWRGGVVLVFPEVHLDGRLSRFDRP